MNIFEIMSSSQFLGQDFFSNFLLQENTWLKLKHIIDHLFEAGSFNLQQTQKFWMQINEDSKHLVKLTMQYYLDKLQQSLYQRDLPQLKKIIQNYPADKMERIATYVNGRFQTHHTFLDILTKPKDIQSSITNEFASNIRMMLLDELKIHDLFNDYFKNVHGKHSKSMLENSMIQYDEETQEFVRQKIQETKGSFDVLNVKKVVKLISDLGFEDEVLESINGFMTQDMRSFVHRFENNIDQNSAYLTKCQIYFDGFHSSFLKMFGQYFLEQVHISRKRPVQVKLHKNSENSKNKIYLSYGQVLSKNIFSIALVYPESERLVKQLKKCIEKVGLINQVCFHLKTGIQNRLLIPGVVTHNILLQYINMLKVLQIIDSSGQIYEQITSPIKNYLLKRSDTLRCIINHLMTDEKQNNYSRLGTQLVKLPSKQYCEIESEDDYDKWDGMSLERKLSIVKYQEIDLVTVLVNLYGSQESFISEYQVMLAQKLMGAKDYSIDEEVVNLERLKQRFGEQALQACNIIVKDFKDSKRIDKEITEKSKIIANQILQPKDLHCIMVSKGYWPINYERHTFNLPKVFKGIFQSYAEQFSKIKAMRKIQFHYDLGYVNIVLEFENGSVPFKCLPVHAIIISYFDETKNKEKRVSVEYLSRQLDLSQSIIRQRLSFWIHKGVVRPCLALVSKQSITLKRLNSYEQASAQFYTTVDVYKKPMNSDDNLEEADQIIIKEGSFEARVKLAEDLIQKIVHFNGPKSAEQILLLLKTVYRSEMNFEFTEAEAKEILKKMVNKKRLLHNGQVYSYLGRGRW